MIGLDEKTKAVTGVFGLILAQSELIGPIDRLVTTCVCGALLAWVLIKTIPDMIRSHADACDRMSKDHHESCKIIGDSVDRQTAAFSERDQKLIELLEKNLQ